MKKLLTILYLEDSAADVELVRGYLDEFGLEYSLTITNNQAAFLSELQSNRYDLILSDYVLPEFDGLSALKLVRQLSADIPFIIISEEIGEERAIECMREGATDYVLKQKINRLGPTVERAVKEHEHAKKQKQHEQMLVAVLNSAPTGIALIQDHKLVWINESLLNLCGYETSELINRNINILCKDFKTILDNHYSLASTNSSFSVESKLKSKEGFLIDCLLRLSMVDTEDASKGFILSVQNMSLQNQMIAALKDEEAFFASLVENIPMNIICKNLNGSITFMNQSCCHLFGKTVDEVIGKTDYDIFSKELADKYTTDDKHVIVTGEKLDLIEKNIRSDGSTMYVHVIKTPVLDANNTIVGVQILFWEVTNMVLKDQKIQQLNQAIEQSPTAVVITNKEGNIEYVNSAFVKTTGYTSEEVLGNNPRILKSGMHPNEFFVDLWKTISNGVTWRGNICNKKKNGELYWESASIAPMVDEHGNINYYIAVKEDITNRKQLEEAYEVLVNQSMQGLYIMQDGKIVFGNEMLAQICGYSLDELFTMNYEEIIETIYPDDRAFLRDQHEKRLRGEPVPVKYEFRCIGKDGGINWIQACSNLITYQNKSAIQTSIIDVTQSKHLEEAYQVLVNQSIQGLVIFQGENLAFANERFSEMNGYSMEELYTMTQEDFIKTVHPDDRQAMIDRQEKRLKGEPVPESYEFRGIRKNGEICWIQTHTCQITFEGKPAIQMAMIDITENKNLGEMLLQSQKMEAVGRLAGGVAHDFNNLLLVIKSYSSFVLDALDPSSGVYEDVKEIKVSADRAAALTRQLLAFSRQQVLELKVIQLNEVVENLNKMIHRLIGENMVYHTTLHPDLKTVKVDPGQVEQIIINLIVNALDAMPDGGTIEIETANMELDQTYCVLRPEVKPGHYVMLSISDTGIGMDKQLQEKIFEPFYTTKPKGKGTGLGLSTVFGIVKQSQGHIDVYSEIGKGTSFKVYFPVFSGKNEENDTTEEKFVISAKEKQSILLVEDEISVRIAVGRILKQAGYIVFDSISPSDAVAIYKDNKEGIDLIVSDVIMPEMNGKQMYDQIHKINPKARVLFMSGYTSNAIVSNGILEIGLEHIQKPFSADALLKKIQNILV